MKYILVGWANLIIGGLGLLWQTIMLVAVYPKMNSLYKDVGAELPLSTMTFPYWNGVVIIFLVGVVYVGSKLAFAKNPSKGIFKWGIVALVVMFIMGGYFASVSLISIISPIYSVTGNR